MPIAYLINQYPKVSHTFIRREIRALEQLGLEIARVSLRFCDEQLVDQDDQEERVRTWVLLAHGPLALCWPTLRVCVSHPVAFLRAAGVAIRLAQRRPKSFLKHMAYLAEAAALVARLGHADVSHVHAHFGTNSAAVALLWNVLGGPSYSFTVHGPEEFDSPHALGLDLKIERAKFVVAISEFGRSQLMRWCSHRSWHKLHVVHCGLDGGFLQSDPTPVPDSRRLVCIGRLCEQKGQGLLIDAAGRLSRAGIDFELVLVGDGPLRSELESLIRTQGLANKVRITGWQSGAAVAAELEAARALVLPSFAEGLPVVIMEALAMGRPVISTYVAGIPELVRPGVCGWLTPAGALEPLCAAMTAALTTPVARLTEMGRQGAASVAAHHCALSEAEKLHVLFTGESPAVTNSADHSSPKRPAPARWQLVDQVAADEAG
jgi:colanic acid/amylovoran biosynthesis glycosyltransferase